MLLFLRDADVVDEWLRTQQATNTTLTIGEQVDLETCEKEIHDLEKRQGNVTNFVMTFLFCLIAYVGVTHANSHLLTSKTRPGKGFRGASLWTEADDYDRDGTNEQVLGAALGGSVNARSGHEVRHSDDGSGRAGGGGRARYEWHGGLGELCYRCLLF